MKFCVGPFTALALLILSGCNGNSATPLAATSDLVVQPATQGATPFIQFVPIAGSSAADLLAISYTIAARPGTVSKPVHVQYSMQNLRQRGYIAPATVTLPVFGLYAGYANSVSIQLLFVDGSIETVVSTLTAPVYTDSLGFYDHPTILVPRSAGATLGFDFFAMKSGYGSPVIMDTDGFVRWLGTSSWGPSLTSIFNQNGFTIGSATTPTLYRLELDNVVSTLPFVSSVTTGFNHNLDVGRDGLLAEISTALNPEQTFAEIAPGTGATRTWDFAQIISDYMVSQGDDPTTFVRQNVDWFHSNAATYDPSDNSLIVSSRENFVMKVGYDTGQIIWILGDPTKYWYTFPSLRAKALTLAAGGLYPVGQHATSITSDGLLMLFNDGLGSINNPAGTAAGVTRTYSAVSAYSIDPVTMTAVEVWDFDYGQTIYSSVCSSVYEAPGKSLLVDYAVADNTTHTREVGLDASHNVVFDIQLGNTPASCGTSWNSVPVALDNVVYP